MKKFYIILILIAFFSCAVISDSTKQIKTVPSNIITIKDTLTFTELNSFLKSKHVHPYDVRLIKLTSPNAEFLYVRNDTVFTVTKINNVHYILTITRIYK